MFIYIYKSPINFNVHAHRCLDKVMKYFSTGTKIKGERIHMLYMLYICTAVKTTQDNNVKQKTIYENNAI